MDWYADHRHGSARWASHTEIQNAGLYEPGGVFLGICPYTGRYLWLHGDQPICLLGGAGTGKGTSILAYNNFYPSNMLIFNPKGEIGAMIQAHQKAVGKEYYTINPAGLHTGPPWKLPQHKVNPFDILKPDSPLLVSDCKRIAAMFIEIGETKNKFFPIRARQWMENLLVAYVMAYQNPTLTGFMRLLNEIESNPQKFKERAENVFMKLGIEAVTRTMYEIINKRTSAPEEYSGVMSTITGEMSFMSDPRLQELFSGADFSLDVLIQKNPPSVVDIAFPAENLDIWNKALRLIVGVSILYQQRSPGAKAFFMIDEAAQMGHFEELERSFTYGRSFYRTMAVFQDIGQIETNYSKPGIQTFLGSSQAKIFIGIRDYETAQLVSNMLGNQTVEVEDPKYSAQARQAKHQVMSAVLFGGADPFQAGREIVHWKHEERHREKIQIPLLTPDQILTLPDNRSIIFLSGLNVPPILAYRQPYYERPDVAGAFMPNPFHM
ncbi:MAG: type IV secretory system conjugative DNA transfer family protein [Methylococcales bacterium]